MHVQTIAGFCLVDFLQIKYTVHSFLVTNRLLYTKEFQTTSALREERFNNKGGSTNREHNLLTHSTLLRQYNILIYFKQNY